MKKHYKAILILLVFLLISLISTGIGVTYAYYRTQVTGAVSGKTSDYDSEIQVVTETHNIIPASNVAVDEVNFYIKNYTGTDSSPTNTSEVYLSYELTFGLPATSTWGSGCPNPISYRLFSVNDGNSNETEISLSNNKTARIDFNSMDVEKDRYRLKVYWDITKNSATCYAGKSGNYAISVKFIQNPTMYSS